MAKKRPLFHSVAVDWPTAGRGRPSLRQAVQAVPGSTTAAIRPEVRRPAAIRSGPPAARAPITGPAAIDTPPAPVHQPTAAQAQARVQVGALE